MSLFSEEELLPLSALQHMLYCPRQCALIHLEQIWVENRYTAEGRILHAVADKGGTQHRKDELRQSGLPVRSLELGLTGVVDVVEFHGKGHVPFPVEFKRGKPKSDACDSVQLCAQALCLEEMLGRPVPAGALFYGKPRRRTEVVFDEALRSLTQETAAAVHELLNSGATPPPAKKGKCARCSLAPQCRPEAARKRTPVAEYIRTEVLES